jgi:dihydrolipoamide dehydrogenase
MDDQQFDICYLGGGMGGYVGAIRAAQLGLRVAVIEREKLGGTCLHRGCIPTKAFLQSAELLHLIRRGADFGILSDQARPDWAQILKYKERVVTQLHRGVEFLMKKNKVAVIPGKGSVRSATEIEVGDRVVRTRNLVIATGSRPRSLPGLTIDGRRIISSDHAVNLDALPRSVVIIGAGAVGVEFACVYNGLGCDVTLVEYLPVLLPLEDQEVGTELAKVLVKRGIKVLTETQVLGDQVAASDGVVRVPVKGKNAQAQTLNGERVLVAVGREGIVDDWGIEKLDVEPTRQSTIPVEGPQQTTQANVFAVGDVAGGYQFAHKAMHEGIIAAEAVAGKDPKPLDPMRVPRATFSFPQVASLGLSEREAKEQGLSVKVGKFPLRGNGKSLILGETEGFVKIITDGSSGDLVGVFALGANAAELIAEPALAKLLESTAWEIGLAVHPHPTVSESMGEAALAVDGAALHI